MKNSDALRKSIIKSALEGNLCKRSTETSRAFFDELVKAGGRTKERSLILREGDKYFEYIGRDKKDITEDIPFSIPDNWLWCRFEDICDFCIGKTPERKTSAYWDSNDVPWVSIADMEDNCHICKTKEFISNKAKEDCFSFEPFEPGSMLMSFKLTIGKTSIVDMPCYCNEAIMEFEPYLKNNTFRAYLFMFIGFLSREIRVTDAIKGSTLNKKKLAKMLIPLPPLCEQEKMMDKMHALNPFLDEYEQLEKDRTNLNNLLKEKVWKSLLKHYFDYDNLQKEYRCVIKPLGNLLEIERGGSPRPIDAFLTDKENGLNWIKIGDTTKGSKYIEKTSQKIIPDGLKKTRMVYPGDFIISNSMSFGRPYILKIQGCIHDGWVVLRNPSKYFDLDYLFYLISSPQIYSQFVDSAGGAVVQNLNIDKVKSAKVIIPDMDAQKSIAVKLERLFTEIQKIDEINAI